MEADQDVIRMAAFSKILLKKSVFKNCQEPDRYRGLFCALLREICVRMPLRQFKISISCAYFSAEKTASDFFNRISKKAAN